MNLIKNGNMTCDDLLLGFRSNSTEQKSKSHVPKVLVSQDSKQHGDQTFYSEEGKSQLGDQTFYSDVGK